jgi:hypothetical protein
MDNVSRKIQIKVGQIDIDRIDYEDALFDEWLACVRRWTLEMKEVAKGESSSDRLGDEVAHILPDGSLRLSFSVMDGPIYDIPAGKWHFKKQTASSNV